ncbi:hypothetical protein [Collimonas silvisoli]|uniref:hypothetical protein n=1 Tax=Collimonas silvisoli TaxID=2825884 RepID=UPI001B8BBEB5|nr:hypothetical protein [Collimonas silvisoli]
MKHFFIVPTIISLGICLSGAAHAIDVGINIGVPAPAIVTPVPVIVTGWHGDRYYDGRRYWERRDWEEHQRHHGDRDRDHDGDHDGDHRRDHRRDRDEGRGHCPPGHAKKGEC